MATPSTAIKSTSRSKSLLCRTNSTGLHTAKPGTEDQGDWELVDKKTVLDDQDKAEWILVGKTEAEKRAQEYSQAVDMDETTKRKHEPTQPTKRRKAKRAKRMSSMSK
ncbi:hypothetical protein PTMSG1_02825 [Pyrenophora teres f. maculata]|nr:hypothetical protein PTMSG1_02825 [Pyrenophora teres f. maculata]